MSLKVRVDDCWDTYRSCDIELDGFRFYFEYDSKSHSYVVHRSGSLNRCGEPITDHITTAKGNAIMDFLKDLADGIPPEAKESSSPGSRSSEIYNRVEDEIQDNDADEWNEQVQGVISEEEEELSDIERAKMGLITNAEVENGSIRAGNMIESLVFDNTHDDQPTSYEDLEKEISGIVEDPHKAIRKAIKQGRIVQVYNDCYVHWQRNKETNWNVGEELLFPYLIRWIQENDQGSGVSQSRILMQLDKIGFPDADLEINILLASGEIKDISEGGILFKLNHPEGWIGIEETRAGQGPVEIPEKDPDYEHFEIDLEEEEDGDGDRWRCPYLNEDCMAGQCVDCGCAEDVILGRIKAIEKDGQKPLFRDLMEHFKAQGVESDDLTEHLQEMLDKGIIMEPEIGVFKIIPGVEA